MCALGKNSFVQLQYLYAVERHAIIKKMKCNDDKARYTRTLCNSPLTLLPTLYSFNVFCMNIDSCWFYKFHRERHFNTEILIKLMFKALGTINFLKKDISRM